MSDVILKNINVNSSSGKKTGQDKILSFLDAHSNKQLDAIRIKAMNHSNAPIVCTTDISRLGINTELG
jgi:hypothetical protein